MRRKPWVEVWRRQTTVMPGGALLWAHDVNNAWPLSMKEEAAEPNSAILLFSVVICSLLMGRQCRQPLLWCGRQSPPRTDAPQLAARHAQAFEGLGLVTSCTRWRSMEDGGAVFLGMHDVFVKNLVVEVRPMVLCSRELELLGGLFGLGVKRLAPSLDAGRAQVVDQQARGDGQGLKVAGDYTQFAVLPSHPSSCTARNWPTPCISSKARSGTKPRPRPLSIMRHMASRLVT